jgi:undecaprenyl-diphosphatase
VTGAPLGGDGYLPVVHLAAHAPGWLNDLVAAWTDYGLFLFAALWAAGWWIARRDGDARRMTAVVAAGLGTVLAFAASTVLKSLVTEGRPCAGLSHDATVLTCPAAGDYSFPSNHATIAAALAVGLLLAYRRLGAVACVAAVAMAASRVWTGQHYPHDVVVGLALGAAVAVGTYVALRVLLHRVLALMAAGPLRRLVLADGAAEYQ